MAKHWSKEDRPAVSWVNVPVSDAQPRVLRVHGGICRNGAEVHEFLTKLMEYADAYNKNTFQPGFIWRDPSTNKRLDGMDTHGGRKPKT